MNYKVYFGNGIQLDVINITGLPIVTKESFMFYGTNFMDIINNICQKPQILGIFYFHTPREP